MRAAPEAPTANKLRLVVLIRTGLLFTLVYLPSITVKTAVAVATAGISLLLGMRGK